MHHAVRATSATRFTVSLSSHHVIAMQMIDKVWYDWQNKRIENKYSYGGGSITPLPSFLAFEEFPTGLPPHLSVSASSDLKRTWVGYGVLRISFASQFNSTIYGDGLWDENITIWDVMDTTGGSLCYVYA